jgi:hypothetical protein
LLKIDLDDLAREANGLLDVDDSYFAKFSDMYDNFSGEFGNISEEAYFTQVLELATTQIDNVDIISKEIGDNLEAVLNTTTNELVIVRDGSEIVGFSKPSDGLGAFNELGSSSSDDMLVKISGIIEGTDKLIPITRYTEIAESGTHNAFSNDVMLGKYDEGSPTNYINQAKDNGYAYFDLGYDDWEAIKLEFDLTDGDMFKLFNKPYLDDAISNNEVIHFSHDPIVDEFSLNKELKYLEANGYQYDAETMTASLIE